MAEKATAKSVKKPKGTKAPAAPVEPATFEATTAETTKRPESAKVARVRKVLEGALATIKQAGVDLRSVAQAQTDAQRASSTGNLLDGEAGALKITLQVADQHLALVQAHAASDGGVDPTKFETAHLHDELDLNLLFTSAAREIEAEAGAIAQLARDSARVHGAVARGPALRVYNDLAALSKNNGPLLTAMAEPIKVFGARARKAAQTRAKNKKKKP